MELSLEDIRLRAGTFELAANWSVGAELTAIVGPSGAGKSTLLSAIAGFTALAAGEIRLDGQPLDALPPSKRPVAMLFQDHNLFPHLTLAQNVGLGLAPRLRLSGEDRKRVDGVLERVGLGGLASRRPGEVSGGQQSRAALARVLVQDRPIICMDEPFAALGPGLRGEMLALASEILSGRIVLLVSHEPQELQGFADRCVFVDGGMAEPPRPTRDMFENPSDALRKYLGS